MLRCTRARSSRRRAGLDRARKNRRLAHLFAERVKTPPIGASSLSRRRILIFLISSRCIIEPRFIRRARHT